MINVTFVALCRRSSLAIGTTHGQTVTSEARKKRQSHGLMSQYYRRCVDFPEGAAAAGRAGKRIAVDVSVGHVRSTTGRK